MDVLASSALGTGPVTLNGGTLFLQRIYATNDLVVNGVSKLRADNGFGDSWSGTVTLNADLTVESTTYGGPLQFNGKISGTGGLIFTGLHGVELNVANDYTGDTKVNSGTLKCNNIDSLPGGGLSISSGGAKVELNYPGTKSVFSLTLGGVEQTAAGTYGSATSDATFKSGYFVGGGTVTVGDPAYAANITSFGANVAGSAAVIGTVAANAAAITWYVPAGTDPAPLAPAFVMSPDATCSDQTSEVIPSPGFDVGPVVYTVVSQNTLVTNVYTVTATVLPYDTTLTWNLASGGTWNHTASNWLGLESAMIRPYFDGVNAIFDNTAGGTIAIDGTLSPLSTTVSAASGNYVFTPAVDGGSITTGSLTKDGAGTLTISGTNLYDGGTTVNAGSLSLGSSANDSLGTGPVIVNSPATLNLNGNGHLPNAFTFNGAKVNNGNSFSANLYGPVTLEATTTFDLFTTGNMSIFGDVSGPGGLTKNGTSGGPLVLSGTNSYTGPTTVTGGTLQCNNVDALGSGALSISGTGKVNLNYSDTKAITSLTLGGETQTALGTYGSVASGADYQSDSYFAGSGMVTLVGLSAYASWADANAPGQTPGEDYDSDGVENGIEYFMGQTGSSFTAMPGLDGTNTITWPKDPTYNGSWQVQTSPNLGTWTDVAGTDNGTSVSYTLPSGMGKLFVRLLVTPAP
jgi:autotransporter-associated beta strand protein